jgi:hypothetical protein
MTFTWQPSPHITPQHAIYEQLADEQGHAIAILEVFDAHGAVYCSAIAPDGERHRLGAGINIVSAKDWAEGICGLKPKTHRVEAAPERDVDL